MDENTLNFCVACGAPLRDSETFCTSCGRYRDAGSCPAGCQPQFGSFGVAELKSNILIIVATFAVIWVIFALSIGVYFIINAGNFADLLDQNELDLITSLGYSVVDVFSMVGALLIISGVCALISAALCALKKYYYIALAACIMSAVFGLIMILGFVGFIVSFFIYKSKAEFKDSKKNVL